MPGVIANFLKSTVKFLAPYVGSGLGALGTFFGFSYIFDYGASLGESFDFLASICSDISSVFNLFLVGNAVILTILGLLPDPFMSLFKSAFTIMFTFFIFKLVLSLSDHINIDFIKGKFSTSKKSN